VFKRQDRSLRWTDAKQFGIIKADDLDETFESVFVFLFLFLFLFVRTQMCYIFLVGGVV
jgi:hypothetical protein